MLQELFGLYRCPVCGRTFHHPMNGWWCPLCGASFTIDDAVDTELPKRIMTRDTEGVAMYVGDKGFYPQSYMPQLSQAAILEIMERLCCWEEGRYTQLTEETEEEIKE